MTLFRRYLITGSVGTHSRTKRNSTVFELHVLHMIWLVRSRESLRAIQLRIVLGSMRMSIFFIKRVASTSESHKPRSILSSPNNFVRTIRSDRKLQWRRMRKYWRGRRYSEKSKISEVNELPYPLFVTMRGELEDGQLPPCLDCLYQHALRGNFEATVWRLSVENSPRIPSPGGGHGWSEGDGHFVICPMTGSMMTK